MFDIRLSLIDQVVEYLIQNKPDNQNKDQE